MLRLVITTSDHERELLAAVNSSKLMHQPMKMLIMMAAFSEICYIFYYIKTYNWTRTTASITCCALRLSTTVRFCDWGPEGCTGFNFGTSKSLKTKQPVYFKGFNVYQKKL